MFWCGPCFGAGPRLLDQHDDAELEDRKSSDSVTEPFLPVHNGRVFGEDTGQDSDSFARNPFQPFDGLPDEGRNALTVRAVSLGILCGALVNASNVYMGLKSGWTFSGTNILSKPRLMRHYLQPLLISSSPFHP